ncbi:MAG TPA: Crp/Fnr family transcriptional regulator [Candidatus Sulfotelmatobacter sp.]|nr:Crp/Fnr family transcriptional regulator [Candidatus Sulfotelmatobacter sp.]
MGDHADIQEIKENELLGALPADDFARLLPRLESLALPPFEILYDFGDEITHVYFPNRNTVVSTLCRTDEDVNVEVALCGNEGVVGLSALFGAPTSPYQNLVQVGGSGSRLTVADAKEEFKRGGVFQELLLRFTHLLLLQTSQTALCNRIHSDEERLARWLLLSDDRIASSQLPLPRELLAKMLGRNHSGVSIAASSLEKAGLISYNGAELVIVDREKLETVACSCYWVVKRQRGKTVDS